MIYTIAVVMIVVWLVAVLTAFTLGGLIHLLLVVAVIMIPVRLIRGENPVK